jgi:hypothetical protein
MKFSRQANAFFLFFQLSKRLNMLDHPDSLYLAVKLGKPRGFLGFPISTPLPLSSALAQFGMMQRNLISF